MWVVAGPGRRRGRPKKKGKGVGKNNGWRLVHSCWAREDSGDEDRGDEDKFNESDKEDDVDRGREEDRGGVGEDVVGGGREEDHGGVVEDVVGGCHSCNNLNSKWRPTQVQFV